MAWIEYFQGSGLLILAASLSWYATAFWLAMGWLFLRRRALRKSDCLTYRPGVTILKPVSGVDECLADNLRSFLRQPYEPLQIIFGAQSPDDPALAIVRSVVAEFPERDVLIIDRNSSDAASPKIGNLETMLPHARHELILLSDSNVRLDPDELSSLVQPMRDERVGLVYQPVIGVDEVGGGAAAENLRLTEYCAMLTIAIKVIAGLDAVMGKGMLCRRSALASIGDMEKVRDLAADDFYLGDFIKRAGWKLHLSTVPVKAVHVHWSWNSFIKRHTRHAALRFRINPAGYLMELVVSPLFFAFVAVILGGWKGCLLGAGAELIKMTHEGIADRVIRGRPLAWRHWLLIPVKDLLMIYIWFVAPFANRVHWRGRTYRMVRQSRLVPIDAPVTAAA